MENHSSIPKFYDAKEASTTRLDLKFLDCRTRELPTQNIMAVLCSSLTGIAKRSARRPFSGRGPQRGKHVVRLEQF